MATNDSGESARFAGMNPPLQGVLMPNGERVVGYSVLDEIALAAQARAAGDASVLRMVEASLADAGLVDGDDYTYDRHDYMPNKRGGVTVEPQRWPLTPYPERNDARLAELEKTLLETAAAFDARLTALGARVAHVETLLHTALNREPTP